MSEILAPAGSKNSALAAINAGADAIYLGLDRFSARSSAENFDATEFEQICRYAHAFGVKVYVALNTVVKDNELNEFLGSAVAVWNCGADALIIQDIFLGKYLKQRYPKIRLHLSTQAGCCNLYAAQMAKDYGFDRVILSRETKLADIAMIAKVIETEVFVQGALCTCFSGQCYMSSFAGGNSGNRGKCKQPCRKQYSIDRKGFEDRAYRLSLSDLSVGESINELIAAGVVSFKIEGRMRRPEYVAAAVSYYRHIIDGSSGCLSDLKRTYNRGNYTKGLVFGQDKSFISSSVQGHIGEYAGVINVRNGSYFMQTGADYAVGDGFKILRDGKEVGGAVLTSVVRGGYILSSRDRLKTGDKAFITTDNRLNERLLSVKRLISVKIDAYFMAGQPACIRINDIEFCGDTLLEQSINRPLTADDIARNFEKVGDYPFLPQIEVHTDGVFMPMSALNAVRRVAYQSYYERLTCTNNTRYEYVPVEFDNTSGENTMKAIITSALDDSDADIVIYKPQNYCEDIEVNRFTGQKFIYLPPYMSEEDIAKALKNIQKFDGIYCDGYYGIYLAAALHKNFFAGTGYNITNSLSKSLCPADYICLSKELTIREANAMSTAKTFYLSSGGIKVMDLIYCPFERKCASCDKRRYYTLTDAENRQFPLIRYTASECRFEVYNCANLSPCNSKSGALIDKTVNLKTDNYTRGHTVTGIL